MSGLKYALKCFQHKFTVVLLLRETFTQWITFKAHSIYLHLLSVCPKTHFRGVFFFLHELNIHIVLWKWILVHLALQSVFPQRLIWTQEYYVPISVARLVATLWQVVSNVLQSHVKAIRCWLKHAYICNKDAVYSHIAKFKYQGIKNFHDHTNNFIINTFTVLSGNDAMSIFSLSYILNF